MNVIPQAVKDGFVRAVGPLAQLLMRLHIRPNGLTLVGFVVVLSSALTFGLGRIRWGGFLMLVAGVFDILDGGVARASGGVTSFGAFLDSTLDRIGESALFTGLGVYFLRGGGPPEWRTLAVGLCFAALAA